MMFGMKTVHNYCYSGSFQEKSFFNLIVMLGGFFFFGMIISWKPNGNNHWSDEATHG